MTDHVPPRLRRLATGLATSLRAAPEAEDEWLRHDLRAFVFTLTDDEGEQIVLEFWARCSMRGVLAHLAWSLVKRLDDQDVTISRGHVSRYTMSGTVATAWGAYKFIGFWRQPDFTA